MPMKKRSPLHYGKSLKPSAQTVTTVNVLASSPSHETENC